MLQFGQYSHFQGLDQNFDSTLDEIRLEIQSRTFSRRSNRNDIRTITLHVDEILYIIKGELEYITAIQFENFSFGITLHI